MLFNIIVDTRTANNSITDTRTVIISDIMTAADSVAHTKIVFNANAENTIADNRTAIISDFSTSKAAVRTVFNINADIRHVCISDISTATNSNADTWTDVNSIADTRTIFEVNSDTSVVIKVVSNTSTAVNVGIDSWTFSNVTVNTRSFINVTTYTRTDKRKLFNAGNNVTVNTRSFIDVTAYTRTDTRKLFNACTNKFINVSSVSNLIHMSHYISCASNLVVSYNERFGVYCFLCIFFFFIIFHFNDFNFLLHTFFSPFKVISASFKAFFMPFTDVILQHLILGGFKVALIASLTS